MDKKDRERIAQTLQWIAVSMDDLQSAKILYYSDKHRNSCFLFQQAVEKANKAFAISSGFTEKQVREISHNQMKIYKQIIGNQKKEMQEIADTLDKFPKVKNHELLKPFDFHGRVNEMHAALTTLEIENNKGFHDFTVGEINYLLNLLEEVEFAKLELPKYSDGTFKQQMLKVSDLLSHYPQQPGNTTQNEFDDYIQNETNLKLFHKFLRWRLALQLDCAFIEYSLFFCAALTNELAVRPRYISGMENPMKIYTKKFPLIKKQEEIMDVFERAVRLYKRLLTKKPAAF